MKTLQFAVVFAVCALGCATASLSAKGSRVRSLAQAPEGCDQLGLVVGQGGGMFGGAYVANDQLMKYALNDALNKAGELGASHVALGAPQLGGHGGTTTTATVTGTAYRCGPSAAAGEQLTPATGGSADAQ